MHTTSSPANWQSFQSSHTRYPELGFTIDTSRMDIPSDFPDSLTKEIDRAIKGIQSIEKGEIMNPDEGRMVGHYWLRNPELAPNQELKTQITQPIADLKVFAQQVHTGKITNPKGGRFENLLIIGIGGSALGPQFIYEALGANSPLKTFFFDNTDPAGIDATLAKIIGTQGGLKSTLSLVVSKSGGTPETRNGMLEAVAAYEATGLDFGPHAVAITGDGSQLFEYAKNNAFITTFPMEDWVGGRTSVMSTVGLVPAALQGINTDDLLDGAKAMDDRTRSADIKENAAMQLALAWHHAGNGKGEKDMVVLPYKDSLVLFSKYLQQLVMESLGKELDLDGQVVNQGVAVYGNKGSTDQHAYVQQLRDGVANFFATFIEVRKGRDGESVEVDPNTTAADYLQGFMRGTRSALYQSGRKSITLSIEEVTPRTVGALIALFERAVSIYALLVNINAYHQPGVEAGKKAAGIFLELLQQVKGALTEQEQTADQIAASVQADAEDVYHCLTHLAANDSASVNYGNSPASDSFKAS
ncbi:glucose-6-phosphate isomerase [Verrucomicrobiaceae bacterium N1E253]|uniref:Glucose-6-phosphate isomerase n=1 Tax=Oceaniferula marina TaxID=2748318 RepID=A0A851GBP6_9BACT|nr:glucose-6-phosphate isomerase [Oceaniferula marina]NWK54599.1 glucose-6-phosphate isomerase [Oceaniferula marina]